MSLKALVPACILLLAAAGCSPKTVCCGEIRADRLDDLVWENEFSGYRAFGPALQAKGERAFGYDIFTKSVPHPVLHARYEKALDPGTKAEIRRLRKAGLAERADSLHDAVSFHLDHGDGMDSFGVGPTLGCGTAALLDREGSIVYPWCWESAEILENGPKRFKVRLQYSPVEVDGRRVVERRIITLDKGSRLNRVEIHFDGLDRPQPLVVGIVVHKENPQGYRLGADYLATADLGDRNVGKNGEMYCGVRFSGTFDKTAFVPLGQPVAGAVGHVLGYTTYVPGTVLTYWFGSAWSKGGVPDLDAWETLLKQFKKK